jgi:hypothetical protein
MELQKQRLVVTVTIEDLTAKIITREVIVISLTKARNPSDNMYPAGLQRPPMPADRRTQNPQQVCKVEWAYKPAANQKNKTTKTIGPMRRVL